jgi:predicted MFS family arabinose efflux permease
VPDEVVREDVAVWRLPGMLPLVALTATGFGGFFALVSVAPLWVARGGAGEAGAGLVTGVLLLVTILTQPFVPWLLNRFGHGVVLAAGLAFLGVPAPLYVLSQDLGPVLALSALRGVGFGVLTVTGSAVVAHLVPRSRRGQAVGVYGLGVAVPNLVLLPGSVALANGPGFGWAFALGGVSVLGIPAAFLLGRVLRAQEREETGESAPLRRASVPRAVLAGVALPSVVLFVVTLSGGGVMTFLPQAVASPWGASAGLFVLTGLAAVSRWWVGRLGDRRGADRLMPPLLALTAAGLVLLAAGVETQAVWVVLVSMALVGTGYGALQNVTLVSAFGQVTPRHFGAASAVWNIGFDAGTGLGAVAVGLVATAAGFPAGFVLSALVVAACIPLSLRLVRPRQ